MGLFYDLYDRFFGPHHEWDTEDHSFQEFDDPPALIGEVPDNIGGAFSCVEGAHCLDVVSPGWREDPSHYGFHFYGLPSGESYDLDVDEWVLW